MLFVRWKYPKRLFGTDFQLGEVYLVFTIYNLKRALSVLGFDELMSRTESYLQTFLNNILQLLVKMSYFRQSKINYEYLLLKV